jgi:hypothetical protein
MLVDCEILAAFGFVANPKMYMRNNVFLYLAQMPIWKYFERPNTMAFHDLTAWLKPPRNIRSLLGLNLKCIPTPLRNTQWRKFEEEILHRFGRELKVNVFTAGKEEDPDYNPKMYIKSDWTPRSFQIPYEIQTHLNDFKQALKLLVKPQRYASNMLRHQQRVLNQPSNQNDFLCVQCDKNLGPAIVE